MVKKKRFEKVVEGWSLLDSSMLLIVFALLIFSLYATIKINPWFSLFSIFFAILFFIGSVVFSCRKVHWEEMK